MLKRLLIGWFAALALVPLSAYALGLGSIEVKSSLTETMDAVIGVVGAEPGDAAGMRVRLAPPEQFRRAGIDRGFHLTTLRFAVEEDPDTELPYIKVTSRQAVKEPLLNFIVELASNDGLVFKEYVVFLDPPGLPSSVAPLVAPMAQPAESATQALPSGLPPAIAATREAPPQAVPGEAIARDRSYGPTHKGDTLWKIASHYASSANEINPLMMAIVDANPGAFIGGNAHRLLPGQVLRLPDQAAVDAISNAEAIAALRSQESAWRTASKRSPDGKASAPAGGSGLVERERPEPATSPVAGTPDAAETPATVRLVRDDRENVPSADAAASAPATGDLDTVSGEARQQVLLLEEQLDSQRQENDELKDRISTLENQIAIFQQLIEELESRDGMRAPGPVGRGLGEGSQLPNVEGAEPADSSYGQRSDGQEPLSDGEGLDEALLPEDPLAGIGGGTGIGIDDDSATVAQSADDATTIDQPATDTATAPSESTEKPAEPQVATRAPPPVPAAPPAPGLVDVLIANLVPIGGGIVVLVLLLFGVRTLRNRRGESVAAPVTELDDAGGTYVAPDKAVTVASVDDDAEDATVVSPDRALDTGIEDVFDSFVSPTAGAASETEIEDVDPIAEADVYLAYGRHEQAEEILQEAIQFDPGRLELKLKLLEILYSQKKADDFAAFAAQVQPLVEGDAETWRKIRSMGHQLTPENPLFTGAEAVVGEVSLVGSTGVEQEVLDLDAVDETEDDSDLVDSLDLDGIMAGDDEVPGADSTFLSLDDDLDEEATEDHLSSTLSMTMGDDIPSELASKSLPAEPADPSETTPVGSTDESLDDGLGATMQFDAPEFDTSDISLDDDLPELSNTIEFEAGDLGVDTGVDMGPDAAEPDIADDMSLEFSLDDESAAGPASEATVEIDEGMSLDFDLPESPVTAAAAEPETVDIDDAMSLDFDISGIDDSGDDDDLEETVVSGISLDGGGETETMQTLDAVASKLDLLAAYVDMGDRDAAADLVSEIRGQGTQAQLAQAEALFAKLD